MRKSFAAAAAAVTIAVSGLLVAAPAQAQVQVQDQYHPIGPYNTKSFCEIDRSLYDNGTGNVGPECFWGWGSQIGWFYMQRG
ncbi:hypothetical protein ACFCV3_36105 [Kribbella sp. NPDC056345]|uniref:hypothetical protein n=1 Tax=Kribbella sp. NPDC056345 TaxID=3345789 RepID=UPI0035D9BD71